MVDKKTIQDEAAAFAVASARLSRDTNCEDIVVLDLRDVSPVTDYFVICTGSSDRQMRAVGDEICDYGKSEGQRVWHVAGEDSGQWIVLDFVDVVMHIFDESHRKYYDLELIWGDAPRVDWNPDAPIEPCPTDEEG